MKWTLINPAGTNDPDTGDIYSGLDRFGRVKDNRWLDGELADLDRIQHGYDRASSRIWRKNVVAAALGKQFDELYTYDGVHRLQDMVRGTLNGGHTALTSETFAESWTLDSTGNWRGFKQDDNGDGTWNLIQSRTANPVNEITDIAESVGPSWVAPAYNRAGNMTTMPQPAAANINPQQFKHHGNISFARRLGRRDGFRILRNAGGNRRGNVSPVSVKDIRGPRLTRPDSFVI